MNFLALVQDLARQSGTLAGGTNIASVSGVSGRADKLVNWIASAWEDIQMQRRWNFLREEFSESLIVNTLRYTAASFNLDRFSAWCEDTCGYRVMSLYDPAVGQADEGSIPQIAYTTWRQQYDRGTHDANRPTVWALSPAGELCVGAKPDQAYTLRGEYWKSPQTLTSNSDTPEIGSEYHKIIVYRAMQLMAAADESVPTLQFASNEYSRLFAAMCRQYLPSISTAAGPLA